MTFRERLQLADTPGKAFALVQALLREDVPAVQTLSGLVPTNWCDPLLTGPDAVIGPPPYTCQDVERVLLAVASRVRTAEASIR